MKNYLVSLSLLLAIPLITAATNDLSAENSPVIEVIDSRLVNGIPGSSVSIVTSEEIANDPASNLPDILSRQAGIQAQSLYGGVNGAGTSIGLRGFGATAQQNTLITVNGRRLNDPEQTNVDLSALPLNSIERIEIIRGSSASVLYGDGAVGGVINIVTRNPWNSPSETSIDTTIGSNTHHEVSASTNQNFGANGFSLYGSDINDNGYRDNNALRQRSGVAEFRHSTNDSILYTNIHVDDQYLGNPGTLGILSGNATSLAGTYPSSLYNVSPQTSLTPDDFSRLSSVNLSTGGTTNISNGVELVVDGGFRHKNVKYNWASFGGHGSESLSGFSFTPRLEVRHNLFSLSSKLLTGIDFDDSFRKSYSNSSLSNGMTLSRFSFYGMENLEITPKDEISIGARIESFDLSADKISSTLRQNSRQFALHLGLDHQVNEELTLFSRIGHSLRFPNIDDTGATNPSDNNGILKPQTAWDAEVGSKVKVGSFNGQLSVYGMNLHDEIDFYPCSPCGLYNGYNANLSPTRRLGVEVQGSLAVTPSLRFNGKIAEIDATYRDGIYKGKTVPQIAALTGNAGITWNIAEEYLVLDTENRYVGRRYFTGDQKNEYENQPAYDLVDVKVSGKIDFAHWSFSILNLFDTRYFDQGIYSSSPYSPPYTPLNIYPMPGRLFYSKIGVTF